MNIRVYRDSDFEIWVEMRNALWPECTLADSKKDLKTYQASGNGKVLIALAFTDDYPIPIGFIETSIRQYAENCDTQNVGYIEGWYVKPQYQRRNVGRQLVQYAEKWAHRQGCQEMASDCFLDNTVSEAAHIKLGYTATARLIHFKKNL